MHQKDDDDSWFSRLDTFLFGLGIFAFGVSATIDPLYNSLIGGLINLGPYHTIIGLAAIALGCLYFYWALKRSAKR
jgi:hypothetical protein